MKQKIDRANNWAYNVVLSKYFDNVNQELPDDITNLLCFTAQETGNNMLNKKYFTLGLGRMLDFSASYNYAIYNKYFNISGVEKDAEAFARDSAKLKQDMLIALARLEKQYGSKCK